jgi:oxygen-independent coproporphyrinogen-3 oxidase
MSGPGHPRRTEAVSAAAKGLLQLGEPALRRSPATKQPLALYVHIPFCVRKCYYCDFASGPAPEAIREQYVAALYHEIRTSRWRGSQARTVFFGGGTPSELRSDQLATIVEALGASFDFGEFPNAEWTIECNPGTVTAADFRTMREMGFNRVSLGVQSFHDHHLKALGRIHTAEEARQAVRWVRDAGFERLNVDLIFCLPDQTLDEWKCDVEAALALGIEHLSLYNLTIEEETEFGARHRLGLLALPDEDLSADMYEWAIDRSAAAGFEQYEVSNFALPGEACRHNQVYWRNQPYLGLGLGAASYMDGMRWVNTRSMARYLETAWGDEGPERSLEERLPPRAACGEAVMLALRTSDGADLTALGISFGLDAEAEFGETVRRLRADGLVTADLDRVRLTRRGIMLANAVCGEFL